MRLAPLTAGDEDLTVRLECDPELMRHIGGARPEADVRATHRRRLDLMAAGEAQMYVIVADDGEALGTIGIWRLGGEDPMAYEMGWIVLPEHQGRGIATEAARLIIAQARADPAVRSVHAFPSVANPASNAVARKIGMVNHGPFDNQGYGGGLRCNDWRIDLR